MNPDPDMGRRRAVIESVTPAVDCGRFPAKGIASEEITIEADIFTDGHDAIGALLLWRRSGATTWNEVPMDPLVNDRWRACFTPTETGRYEYTIAAWVDALTTWRRDMKKRVDAGTATEIDFAIGKQLLERGEQDRRFETRYNRVLELVVDPPKARFSSWYEFFPRSFGTFADATAHLDYVADLGFDVVYLPPVHPIGKTFRKGRNNTLTPDPEDPGSPWAIGGPEGGHKAIHPSLGTIDDFRNFVSRAGQLGLSVALDIAFQVSPDHPYATGNPNWFRQRPDGTIQYAENPPKKYQDIYPFDFESEEWQTLWHELRSIFDFWIGEGVTIFRVDNPHTKAFPFWEWCINAIKAEHPEVLFLSEAFTRPKVMYRLAKLGFSQSYTYFPWRHGKEEIIQYFNEITKPPISDFFRGNHWPNTPDILTEFLQTSGRAGFVQRFLLTATLAANYGIYGPAFELAESRPFKAGSEEYLDSEKYQVRQWDLDREDSLRHLIAQVNRIRREHPALQNDTSLRFLPIDNEDLLAFTKQSRDGSDVIVVVVSLEPEAHLSGELEFPIEGTRVQAYELLTGKRQVWRGSKHHVQIESAVLPAHIYSVRRHLRTERDFDYFL